MNYRMIANIVGKIVCVEAAFMLPALGICLYCHESAGAVGIAAAMGAALAFGGIMLLLRPKRKSMFAREGLVAVGLAWIAVSLFGALPFFISGAIPRFVDCFFETVSGFTTTGATILADVESLPRGLIYWRSFTHWLGGMGVLVFVLALSPLGAKDSGESMHLLRAESPGIKITKLVPRMRRSAGILYAIYVVMTVLQAVLLLLGKESLFDSVNIALGTAGTGGFAIKNDSMASYSAYTQWVTTVFMLLFGVNFSMYFLILMGEAKKVLKNEETRVFFMIVIVSSLIIALDTRGYFASAGETLRAAFFQVASIISTTGYCSTDFDLWPQLSRTILVALMFVGGCAGSTGGGAKVVRIIVMFKLARRGIHRVLHPNSVSLVQLDGETLDDATTEGVSSYMMLYFIILAAVTLLVSLDGMDLETNFTAAVSCLNNVGPGMAGVGATMNYGGFSPLVKLVLSAAMLIGRLEIYPILTLFLPSVWRK